MEIYDEKHLIMDAFQVKGSHQFALAFHVPNHQSYKLQVYQKPDNMNLTLIHDVEDAVQLVTWLDDGNILLKVGNRFLLFNDCGNFIDEIEFHMKEKQIQKQKVNVVK